MTTLELLVCEPLLEEGIEDVAFWNGRVLVAEDLADQRDAHIERARLVAQAGGEGVARGLMVTPTTGNTRAVDIEAGLAVARSGEVLHLPVPVRLALVAPPGAEERVDDFADCAPLALLTGVGVYLLTIGPASGTRGSAPAVALASDGVVRHCGPRYDVDGVRFRLVPIDPVALAGAAQLDAAGITALTSASASVHLRRNILAHLFLGTVERRRFVVDPFVPEEPRYGPVDELRAGGALGDDEVPLALISWRNGGVEYLDAWAARRRVHRSRETEHRLAALASARAGAEGEATWHQFQEHLADLARSPMSDADLADVRAVDHFRYLPAAGLFPIRDNPSSAPGRGLDFNRFIQTLPVARAAFMSDELVSPLLRAGIGLAPLDLTDPQMLWLYVTRENVKAWQGPDLNRPKLHVVFAGGHLAHRGGAQFDVAWWDYANFGLTDPVGGTP